MSKKLLLEIVTPDRKVLSQDVDYVGAPGALGEFGVLPNHIPFLSALGIGNLYYKDDGRTHYVFVSGGFAEVTPEKVTVLAEAFTGTPGRYVKLEDTIKGFKEIIEGKHDDIPESAFYMVGDIAEAIEKAKQG